jgi:hypothetical protein
MTECSEDSNPRERRGGRCASRSGAGGPAFDLCQLGHNMGFVMEKINENPSSDSAPFPHLNSDIPRAVTVQARKAREDTETFVHPIGVNRHRRRRSLRVSTYVPA